MADGLSVSGCAGLGRAMHRSQAQDALRRRWDRLMLVGGSALLACGPRTTGPEAKATPTPAGEAVAAQAPEPHSWVSSPVARLEHPPPLPPSTLKAELDRWLADLPQSGVPEEPRLGTQGPVLFERDPRRTPWSMPALVQALRADPTLGSPGRKVQAEQLFLRRHPGSMLKADGTVTLEFETVSPASGASVHYGTLDPNGPLARARYRYSVHEPTSDPLHLRHALAFPLAGLLAPGEPAADLARSGRGLAAWRLEILDAKRGTAHLFDGDLSFRCEPLPCTAGARFVQLPSFRAGPTVDLPTSESVVISWTTDVATTGLVLAQAEGEDIKRFSTLTPGTRHEVTLTGLAANTRYRYQVLSVDRRREYSVSRGATFETAPDVKDPSRAITFVLLSGAHSTVGTAEERYDGTNLRVLRGLLTASLNQNPDFVVLLGDLVEGHDTEAGSLEFELQSLNRALGPLSEYLPMFEGMGEHESLLDCWEAGWAVGKHSAQSAESLFGRLFVNPTNGPEAAPGEPPYLENVFSFDYGIVHVAIVNSAYWWRSHPARSDHPAGRRGQRLGWINDQLLEWLDQDLRAARARGLTHLIVGTHAPAFPNGGAVQDSMYWGGKSPEVLAQRAKFLELLGRRGVRLILAGHEQNYSRTRVDQELVPGLPASITQVTSGGAGAPYELQDGMVPWSRNVERFDTRHHFVTVRADGRRISVEAFAEEGAVVDRFEVDVR